MKAKLIKATLPFFLLFIFSCNKVIEIKSQENPSQVIENLIVSDTLEHFSDSTNFGIKAENRIDIYKIGTNSNTFIRTYLFKKIENNWILNDSLIIEGDLINNLNTEISDFNNDQLNDIIFTSGTANRGGNNVQTLILYSKESDKLKWIKNSENFPNLIYKKKLDCIDAIILTGGQTTYFLKIKNDSLKEFANVDQRDNRIVSEILDKNGKWQEIENIEEKFSGFDRFINFDPIEVRE